MSTTLDANTPELSRVRLPDAWLSDLLTRSYLPSCERYLRWLRHPLGILLLADAACGLCGAILHPNGFLLAALVTSMILLGLAWPWLSLAGITGEVSFASRRGRELEECEVELRVTNRCPWPAWGLSLDGLLSGDVTAALDVVPGWRRGDYRWRLRPTRRGVYPVGEPRVSTSFPFGLWRASRRLRSLDQIIVWPTAVGGSAAAGLSDEECRGEGLPLARPGGSGDLLGVRPYRPGDTLRSLHWAKSAQLDRLITCERERLLRPQAQLVLDTHRDSHTDSDDGQESAIRLAAGVGCRLLDEGAEVTAVLAGRLVRLPGSDPRRTLLDVLARLEADECPPLDELLALSAVRRFQGHWQFVVTSSSARDRLPQSGRGERRRRYVLLDEEGFRVSGSGFRKI